MYVSLATLTIGKKQVPPGTVLDPDPARNFRSLLDSRRVIEVPDKAIKAILRRCLAASHGRTGQILGSDIQPNVIDIDGEPVALGELVRKAFERSGLSAIGWNALPGPAREMLLWAEAALWGEELDEMPASDRAQRDDEPVGPAPDGPSLLFDPAEHGLKYQGSVVGHTIVSGSGAVVARVSKETYGALKKAAQKGRSMHAPILSEGSG